MPDIDQAIRELGVALHQAGVTDLDNDLDRKLCEWHIAMGHITEQDRQVLLSYAVDDAARPMTTTQSQINDQIKHLVRITARHVAVLLEPQLQQKYGPNWLDVINKKYKPPHPSDLEDSRFCLKVFTVDTAAHAFSTKSCRQHAHELLDLAHQASHDRRNTTTDLDRTRELHEAIVTELAHR